MNKTAVLNNLQEITHFIEQFCRPLTLFLAKLNRSNTYPAFDRDALMQHSTTNSSFCKVHHSLYTYHSTKYTTLCIHIILQSTPLSVYISFYKVHHSLYTYHSTKYTTLCIHIILQSTPLSVYISFYKVHHSLYTYHSTKYTTLCIHIILQSTPLSVYISFYKVHHSLYTYYSY